MLASLLSSPAAFAQTHGTYTVGYSGGSASANNGTTNGFGAGGGQYGASGSASASTDSSGNAQTCSVSVPDPTLSSPPPLTATFTWHPDPNNPNEPPPAAAIVSQTCQASWMLGGSYSGATGGGDANNGLGTVAPASTTGADAEGTKYTAWSAPNPSHPPMTFMVQCSPSAHFSGGSGSVVHAGVNGSIQVTYYASATPVFVDLGGTTLVNGVQEALTGQPIAAILYTPNGLPSGTKITSYTWSFDEAPVPHPIKYWDGHGVAVDGTPQQLFPLTPSDLTGTDTSDNGISVNPVSFYDQYAESLSVKCAVSLKFADGTTATVNAKSMPVTFIKPSVTAWGVNTHTGSQQGIPSGTVQPGVGTDANKNNFYTMFADEIWGPITISVPLLGTTAVGGQGCIVQVQTKAGDSATRTPVGIASSTFIDVVKNASGNYIAQPTPALDSGFPFPFGYNLDTRGIIVLSNTGSSIWDVSKNGYSGDEPTTPVFPTGNYNGGNNWTQSVFSSAFDTYIMYKPPSGIWVPLQKLSWSYSLTAGPTAGGPIVDPYDNQRWNVSNPVFSGGTPSNTDTPPSWSSVAVRPLYFGAVTSP